MKIYVTVMSWGSYDEHDEKTIYVGTYYAVAVKRAKEFDFPDPYANWGIVYTWENGEQINYEIVRE